jgi:hypothetical protein
MISLPSARSSAARADTASVGEGFMLFERSDENVLKIYLL